MDHKEFQKLAVRTESIVDVMEITPENMDVLQNTVEAYIALSDVLDVYKKHIFYGREIDSLTVYSKLGAALLAIRNTTDSVNKLSNSSQPPVVIDFNPRIFHALLGTITEHGELAIALSDILNSKEVDLVNVCEELGDSDWYKALFYEATGVSWDDVQSMIIKKLEVRYADNIFTDNEANERDLEAERKLLDQSIIDSVNEYKQSHE